MNDLENIAPLFVAILESGSFTSAAKKLGVSKSYLSEQLKSIEQAQGITLLHRTTRSLSPTDAGRIFYEQSKKLLEWRLETEEKLAQTGQEATGTLNITSVQAFAEFQLHQVLKQYQHSYPKVKIKLVASNRQIDIVNEDFDFAIRLTEKPPSHLIAKKILDVSYVCCASPKYFEKHHYPNKPEDLQRHDCAITPETVYWQFSQGETTVKQKISGSVVTSSNHLFRKLALEGSHIVRVPAYVISKELKQGLLIRVLNHWQPDIRSLYLIYAQQKEIPLKMKGFIQCIQDQMQHLNQVQSSIFNRNI